MPYKNKKETVGIFKNGKAIQTIYLNGKIIWQAVRSCFGAGMWVSAKPWIDDEGWSNI